MKLSYILSTYTFIGATDHIILLDFNRSKSQYLTYALYMRSIWIEDGVSPAISRIHGTSTGQFSGFYLRSY